MNSGVVDAIGSDRAANIVVLKIFDHLDWSDEASHLFLLQDKINSYLRFLESGEVFVVYPDAKDRKLQISVAFMFDLTENCVEFMNTASKIVADAGFSLTYSVG